MVISIMISFPMYTFANFLILISFIPNAAAEKLNSEYQGEVIQGRYEGKGLYICSLGRYEGEFADGLFHGHGTKSGLSSRLMAA